MWRHIPKIVVLSAIGADGADLLRHAEWNRAPRAARRPTWFTSTRAWARAAARRSLASRRRAPRGQTGQCLAPSGFARVRPIRASSASREDIMADTNVPRRSFLKGAGAAGTLAATVLTGALPRPAEAQSAPAPAAQPAPQPEPMLTLTATEAAFLSAAYDTIIPADALSPSGTDCGLVTYIDRQLAGAWGSRRADVPQRTLHPEQGRIRLSAAAQPSRIFRRRHQGDERLDDQDLRQGVRPALARRPRGDAERDGAEPSASSKASTPSRSSKRCCNRRWKASSPIRSMAATATRWRGG